MSSGTVTGMAVEIDRQAAAVIDALAAVRSRRPSLTRTIRNCQLTAGQEIDVLVVSRAEAATALVNLDGRIGRHRRSGNGVQPVLEEAGDGTSEVQLVRLRLAAGTVGKEPDVAGKKRPKSLAQTEKKAPAKPKRPKKTSRGK